MQRGMIVHNHRRYKLLVRDYGGNCVEMLTFDFKMFDLIQKLFIPPKSFEVIVDIGDGKIHKIEGATIYSYSPQVHEDGKISCEIKAEGISHEVSCIPFDSKTIGQEKVIFN